MRTDIYSTSHDESLYQMCKASLAEEGVIADSAIWELYTLNKAEATEDMWSTMDDKGRGKEFFLTGTLGLWNGRRQSGKLISLEGIFGDLGCDDIDIFMEDGDVHVWGHHHDGTHKFVVKEFTDLATGDFKESLEANYFSLEGMDTSMFKSITYLFEEYDNGSKGSEEEVPDRV